MCNKSMHHSRLGINVKLWYVSLRKGGGVYYSACSHQVLLYTCQGKLAITNIKSNYASYLVQSTTLNSSQALLSYIKPQPILDYSSTFQVRSLGYVANNNMPLSRNFNPCAHIYKCHKFDCKRLVIEKLATSTVFYFSLNMIGI